MEDVNKGFGIKYIKVLTAIYLFFINPILLIIVLSLSEVLFCMLLPMAIQAHCLPVGAKTSS